MKFAYIALLSAISAIKIEESVTKKHHHGKHHHKGNHHHGKHHHGKHHHQAPPTPAPTPAAPAITPPTPAIKPAAPAITPPKPASPPATPAISGWVNECGMSQDQTNIIFDKLDTNHDGELGIPELKTGFEGPLIGKNGIPSDDSQYNASNALFTNGYENHYVPNVGSVNMTK